MRSLVLDCSSGISGDMTVATLIDLGADASKLKAVLDSLPDRQFEIKISRVKKSTLDACDFSVLLKNGEPHSDHDMQYLFGQDSAQKPTETFHVHAPAHAHDHEHDHDHDHEEHLRGHGHEHEANAVPGEHSHHDLPHAHGHRHLTDVLALIARTCATEKAKALAAKIFTIIAEAEAKAHGVTIDEVHFHEVGALDSIIDILSVAVLLDDLKVDEVIVPSLCEGHGQIRCQHGVLPIPVPAVAHIAAQYGLTLSPAPVYGELITPTGAAIVAAVKTSDSLPERYVIKQTGFGAGKREYSRPSLLRAMIIESETDIEGDRVVKLETNIDDTTPEILGYALEKIYAEGALEAWFTPVFMKKGRPAYLLTVLTNEGLRRNIENVIFRETTTIGIRRTTMRRTTLVRRPASVQTPWGAVEVKECILPDGSSRFYPEYETLKQIASDKGLALRDVYKAVLKNAQR